MVMLGNVNNVHKLLVEKMFAHVKTKRLQSIICIILRLWKEGVDRAGSVLCLVVEYRTGHAEISVIAATGD
jgi:hypothetical protein